MKKLLAALFCASMILGGCSTGTANAGQPKSENEQYDIVIVGAGGAGLAAAVEAREQGADNILLLEKMSFAGEVRQWHSVDSTVRIHALWMNREEKKHQLCWLIVS